jgi:hypothetical protein
VRFGKLDICILELYLELIMSAGGQQTDKRQKRAHNPFTKLWLLNLAENNPKMSAIDLGRALAHHVNSQRSSDQVPRTAPGKATVNDWRKNAVSIRNTVATDHGAAARRDRAAKHPVLEDALYLWFRQQEARDLTITDEVLTGQAKVFGSQEVMNVRADFQHSKGWLDKFKKRHGIRSYTKHGEAANAEGVRLAQENVRKVLLDGGFSKDETYNQDESGFFWRQLPTRSHGLGKKAGRTKDKQRVTVSFVCNASGTHKLPLHIIGKAARPGSFPKSFQPTQDMGFRYSSNKTARMTSSEFSGWAKEWNSKLGRCVAHFDMCLQI